MQFKTSNPDGSTGQRFPLLLGISLSGNRHIRCCDSLPSQNFEPQTLIQCHLSSPKPRGPTLPLHRRDFMDRESMMQVFVDVENPERRTPTSRDLAPRVSVAIDDSDQIGESLLAISMSMNSHLVKRRRPNPDVTKSDGLFPPSPKD
jgi:hypothetical protein